MPQVIYLPTLIQRESHTPLSDTAILRFSNGIIPAMPLREKWQEIYKVNFNSKVGQYASVDPSSYRQRFFRINTCSSFASLPSLLPVLLSLHGTPSKLPIFFSW